MKLNLKAFSIRRMMTTLVFIFSVVIAQFANIPFAAAATTLTWDGSAGDNKFSTAENWSGDVAPVDGDSVVFDASTISGNTTIDNDLTNLSLGGISFVGDGTQGVAGSQNFTLSGNPLVLTGDISNDSYVGIDADTLINYIDLDITLGADITMSSVGLKYGSSGTLDTNGHNLTLNSDSLACTIIPKLSGTGLVTLGGEDTTVLVAMADNSGYSGAITLNSAKLYASVGSLGSSSAGTTVSGSGKLILVADSNSTWSEPLILSGSGSIAVEQADCSGGISGVVTATLTGAVTLQSDFKYSGSQNLKITGTYTSNGHAFTVPNGVSGTLTLPTGAVSAPIVKTDLSGSNPTAAVTVINKEIATLSGTRGAITVNFGGTLKGNGTANSISGTGTISPGNSPGKITVLNNLDLSGTLQSEVLNKDTYDQLVVGEDYSGGSNAVRLNSGSKLDLVLYDGWVVKKDDAFRIIDNKSSTIVAGTFDGLAEGAQFTVDGITFSISYVGGDGNDVVVTALNTGSDPTPPNTGIAQTVLRSPLAIVVLGVISAGVLAAIALRRRANQ